MSDWRGPRYASLSLTTKLALLFSAVVAIAFGFAYFYMVPELRSNLQQQQLADLQSTANETARDIEGLVGTSTDDDVLDANARRAAATADARLTVIGVSRSEDDTPGSLFLVSDSLTSSDSDSGQAADGAPTGDDLAPKAGTSEEEQPKGARGDRSGVRALGAGTESPPSTEDEQVQLAQLGVTLGVADEAFETGETSRGLGRENGRLTAQVAVPVESRRSGPPQFVALYSRSLAGVGEAVGFIERRLLVAGVIAVLIALAGGWLVARTLARRVHRLESAAGKVADGDLLDPLPVDSEDELGQLTRAFNEMQAKLARIDRARRDFIANASHELRTPIFSLGGFAELLQDEDLDLETRERFIRSMREQIDRLQKLTSDLLDLSRLDAGSIEIHPRVCDLGEIMTAVVGEFAPLAAQRGSDLRVESPVGGVEGRCDPERVAQIMRVLVDNSLRHNASGTRVTVTGSVGADGAEISVIDDGEELDPATEQRVFERFYTGDPSGGSGLGLAIARELARRMGGDITLESRPGETTFTLALPPTAEAEPARSAEPVGAGRS